MQLYCVHYHGQHWSLNNRHVKSLHLYAPPLQPDWLRRVDILEVSRNYAGIAEGVASLVGADLARAMPLSERDTSYELSKLHDLSKLVIEILPSRPPQTAYTPNPFPRQQKVA